MGNDENDNDDNSDYSDDENENNNEETSDDTPKPTPNQPEKDTIKTVVDPVIESTIKKEPGCGAGFKFDDNDICVDIDECHGEDKLVDGEHPGGCPNDRCMNLYGDYVCYDWTGHYYAERPFCHHYFTENKTALADENIYAIGHNCQCYPGYRLCDDEMTCSPSCSRRTSVYIPKKVKTVNCGQCQGRFGYDNNCYQQSAVKKNFADATADCSSMNGKLVTIKSREAWWYIGSQVHGGNEAFWIAEDSKEIEANMYVVGEDETVEQGFVVNVPKDMAHVPPQWNFKATSDLQHYVCQLDAGTDLNVCV